MLAFWQSDNVAAFQNYDINTRAMLGESWELEPSPDTASYAMPCFFFLQQWLFIPERYVILIASKNVCFMEKK